MSNAAYEEGYLAYFTNLDCSANPYIANSERAIDWEDGWGDAQDGVEAATWLDGE